MARLSAGLPLSFGGCAFFPGTETLRVAVNARDAASDAKSTSSPRSAYSSQRGQFGHSLQQRRASFAEYIFPLVC